VKADPLARFVAVSLLSTMKRSTNSIYAPKDPIFDFLIYLSLVDELGVVDLVVWDKDMCTWGRWLSRLMIGSGGGRLGTWVQ
jgi:hypothetical protein